MLKYIIKNFSYLFRIIVLAFVFIGPWLSAGTPENTLKVFRKFSEKLRSVRTISYHYTREFIYPAEDYHSTSQGEMYIDFSKENDLTGFRYQYKDESGFYVFNNAELFETSEEDKTIQISTKIKISDFDGLFALYNSIITMRNILPAIIADRNMVKQVKDTLIGKKTFYLLSFITQDKYPDYLGLAFKTTTQKIIFHNKIIVDKKSFLPVSYIQLKEGSSDISRTDFSDIKLNPAAPEEKSWYYSTYLKDYRERKKESVTPISVGSPAPDFTLIQNETGEKVSLSNFQGHPVLLEFWIKNCSYCINAVPELNTLNTKYRLSGLKIWGINATDSQQAINQFVSRQKVNYTVLLGDATVAKNYGICAFPHIVLIDKKGNVIYSGGLDMSVLDVLIRKNL